MSDPIDVGLRLLVRASLLYFGAGLLVAHVVVGCVKRSEKPACSEAELGKIEAAYVAEAVATCRGQTVDTCAELPGIEAKYSKLREAWVSCR